MASTSMLLSFPLIANKNYTTESDFMCFPVNMRPYGMSF